MKKFPEGRNVYVYYDPADPAHSALEQKGSTTKPTTIVFLVVFTRDRRHPHRACHCREDDHDVERTSDGGTLLLPSAALLVAVGAIVIYFVQRRDFKASASWPAIPGKIVSSKIIEETERERDDGTR